MLREAAEKFGAGALKVFPRRADPASFQEQGAL